MSVQNKVIVVTGAGGAAGPPACRALAAAGATVIACDVLESSLHPLADDIRAEGGTIETHAVDLLDEAATEAWAGELRSRHGHIDGLVHLVGGWRGGKSFVEEDLADWDFLEQRLVRTLQRTTRAFHAALTDSEAGRVVIVSAKAASSPSSKGAHYAAAKAASEAWMLAVAHGWRASETAAATILVVNGLVTDEMRAAKPEAKFASMTDVADVAKVIVSLWDKPATELNGERLWLTP
ncbi:SDR family NAD(P)-dependent oxidoreductase [Sciscionella marina]|uniref:SDR family NAD(P)-dependent oxidoreductase n=1 Tax=Sciscionella marina TaxID=508770 RepID=UPI00036A9E0A|nr:SDR family NAD(P)-dependent oxidoreductase [Sciscionella marina]